MSQQEHPKYVSKATAGTPSAYHSDPECGGLHGEEVVVVDDLPRTVPGCRICTTAPDAQELRKQLHGDTDD